jgi:hypothetical protein
MSFRFNFRTLDSDEDSNTHSYDYFCLMTSIATRIMVVDHPFHAAVFSIALAFPALPQCFNHISVGPGSS